MKHSTSSLDQSTHSLRTAVPNHRRGRLVSAPEFFRGK
jgi:hypothetical protein